MAGPDVVVLPGGGRPRRIAAGLRERNVKAAAVAVDEAHERVTRERPDLVVCLDAEGRSPLELLAAVREADAAVPVVMVAPGDERASRLAAAADEATTVTTVDGSGGQAIDAVAAAIERQASGVRSEHDRELTADADEFRVRHDRSLTILDNLPDPVVFTSLGPDPAIRYVNAAFEEQFGFDADAICGRRVDDLLLPETPDSELVDFSDVEAGTVVERTVSRRTADGVREFLFRGFRTTVAGWQGAFVVYTDVTECRRRARRLDALHGNARELLTAEDATAVAEVAVDAAREILDLPATGVFVTTGGDRLEPAASSEFTRELFDDDLPEFTPDDEVVWTVYETGEPRAVTDFSVADDGDRGSPIRSAMIFPLGDHGVFISTGASRRAFDDETVDLARLLAANTEAALTRVRNVAAVRERERELRALIENIPIPAVSVEHGRAGAVVLEVNPAFEETFGYDAAELVGENIDDHVTPEDPSEEAATIADRASAEETISREVQRQTADGLRDFLLTTAPVEPGTEAGRTYGFYIDITESQQDQQRLQVLSRVLRHDIRNQVTFVQGTAELIADRATDSAVREAADDVARSAQELAEIGQKTRIVERTQMGTEPGEISTLGRIVQGVVSPVGESFPDARIDVDVPDDAPVASAEGVALAVRELVENAVVHNDADEPRVWVSGRTTGEGFLELSVADDGPGLPDEELAVLTGEREPTQLEHGSGLGLWMAKWIVTGVGGELDIQGRGGGGAVVELSVPLASAED